MAMNRLRYAMCIGIAFFTMVMFEGSLVQAIFLSTLIIPILFFIILILQNRELEGHILLDKNEIEPNEVFNVGFSLNNWSIFPISKAEVVCEVTDAGGSKFDFTMITNVMSRSHRNCVIDLRAKYAGAVRVRIKYIKLYDYLGIFSLKKSVREDVRLMLSPQSTPMNVSVDEDESEIMSDGDKYSSYQAGRDKSEIFDIVEYHEGDNIKDIHWKLSLKSDKLMTKRYGMPVSDRVNVFVDFSYGSKKQVSAKAVDGFLTYALSLINELSRMNKEVFVYSFNMQGEVYRVDSFSQIIGADTGHTADIGVVIDNARRVAGGAKNVFLSSRICEEDIEKCKIGRNTFVNLDERDVYELVIGEWTYAGMSVEKSNLEENSIVSEGNIVASRQDEKVNLFTRGMWAVLIFLGVAGAASAFNGTYNIYNNSAKIYVCACIGVLVISVADMLSKRKQKLLLVLIATIVVIAAMGPSNIINGIGIVIENIGTPVTFIEGGYYDFGGGIVESNYGILITDSESVRALSAVMAYILSIVLFAFTRKNVSVIAHLFFTLPLISVCLMTGYVPEHTQMYMYGAYLFMLGVYKKVYSNISKKEKNKYKKSYYESTVNIGSTIMAFTGVFVVAVMFIDYVTGYERNEKLNTLKTAVNEMIEDGIREMTSTDSDAIGGISDGKLGMIDTIKFSGDVQLHVTVIGNIEFPLYIKAFTGTTYNKNEWIEAGEDQYKAIDELGEEYFEAFYELPYDTLTLEREGMTDITSEQVKYAEVCIAKIKENDTRYYTVYSNAYNSNSVLLKNDGLFGEYTKENIVHGMQQITRPDNIQKENMESMKKELMDIYMKYAKQHYISTAFEDSANFYREYIADKYVYNGKEYNLKHGVEKNGYEVYISYVREFLSENFEYTLSPGRLLEGEDFIGRFLEEKKGYCTHFASLATMMFRMYGIPARYCEGYYALPDSETLKEYNEHEVAILLLEDKNAHAWTEIFVEGYGWMPVEVTTGYDSNIYEKLEEVQEEEDNTFEVETGNTVEKETTTKKKQQSQNVSEKETTTEAVTESVQDKEVSYNGIVRYIAIAILLGGVLYLVSIPVARRSAARRKINSQDDKISMNEIEVQLYKCLKFSGAVISENRRRLDITRELAQYFEDMSSDKKQKFDKAGFIEGILVMFAIMDKAKYSEIPLEARERELVKEQSLMLMKNVYNNQKFFKKLYMKYIKSLYLG